MAWELSLGNAAWSRGHSTPRRSSRYSWARLGWDFGEEFSKVSKQKLLTSEI